MLLSYLIGVAGIVLLMAVWLLVQNAWGRSFTVADPDQDVLAGRGGCQGCTCSGICEREKGSPERNTTY